MDIRLVVLATLAVLFGAVSGRPHGRIICPVSRYVTVSTTDIKMLKQLQSESEENLNAGTCYSRMMKHKPSACKLKPSDRLILTLERVSLAVDVLTNLSTSDPTDPASQSLMAFLKLQADLMICRQSPEYRELASLRLKTWLHHLQHFKETESAECVQDAVLLSIIALRLEDVTCWAQGKRPAEA